MFVTIAIPVIILVIKRCKYTYRGQTEATGTLTNKKNLLAKSRQFLKGVATPTGVYYIFNELPVYTFSNLMVTLNGFFLFCCLTICIILVVE